jgi:hypothetical protein
VRGRVDCQRLVRRVHEPNVDGVILSAAEFETPHGTLYAKPTEIYLGLNGQPRICLVDAQGRVNHFDTAEVYPVGDPLVVHCRTRQAAHVDIEFRMAPQVASL